MTIKKENVPAAPDTTATPPATEKGADTSVAAAPTEAQSAPEGKSAELPLGFLPYQPAGEAPSDAGADVEEVRGPEPGSADFDAEAPGVSAFEIEEHIRILKARKKLKALNNPVEKPAPVPVTVVDAAAKATPAPLSDSDIIAVRPDHGRRGFSQITWDAMETQGEHAGWTIAVEKPADIV